MKFKLYFTFFIGLVLFAFSCKTASKLYEKGNFDEAVELAAKKLQKDPDDSKLLELINNAYSYAVNDHERRIHSISISNKELGYESIYQEYLLLQRMYDAISKVPSVMEIVKPFNYSDYLITYSQKASDVRYERGMVFMQGNTKQSYQDAYREFQLALRFDPGNHNATNKLNEAYESAVTNVVILPMQQQNGYVYSSYNLSTPNLEDQMVRNLQYNSGNQFIKFYSVWDVRSLNVRVDQEVDLRIITMDIGRQYDNRTARKVSKDIVIKETVYKPDSVVKEYARIYANVITTTRTSSSSVQLQMNVRNSDGRWMWNDNVNAVYNWRTDFATFTGDERALSDADKQIVNRRHEFAPPESEIMRILLENITNDALYRIRNYFNRY